MRKKIIAPVQTERLILRTPSVADAPALNTAICESFADLHQWMKWADKAPTLEESITRAQKAADRFQNSEDFTMWGYLAQTGEFVLACGLHPMDWEVPKFEIGYWCRTTAQGKGYVTEAVQAVTQAAFNQLDAARLEIRCDARNIRSSQVALRAGYTLEAELKRAERAPDGALRNTLIYVRFCEEFNGKK